MGTALQRTAQLWRATWRRDSSSLAEAANPDNRRSSMPPAATTLVRHRRRKLACPLRSTGLAGGSSPPSRRLDGVGDLPDQRPTFPKPFEVIDDIAIYRHPLPPEGRGALAYFREYSTALFHEFRLLFKVHRERGFSIIQACNPPDLIFLAALPFKLIGQAVHLRSARRFAGIVCRQIRQQRRCFIARSCFSSA